LQDFATAQDINRFDLMTGLETFGQRPIDEG